MAYVVVLTAHSWLRWAALLLGLASTVSAFRDSSALAARPRGSRLDAWWMAAVDLQVLLGLVLYLGLSPLTRAGLGDLGAAVRSPALRFWTIDHTALMLAAVVLLRLGRIFTLTAKTAPARRMRRLTCFALALLAMAVGIPWPGSSHSRPLFRAPATNQAVR